MENIESRNEGRMKSEEGGKEDRKEKARKKVLNIT